MTPFRSHAEPAALAATVTEFEYIGRRAVAQIVDYYAHELRLQRLRENPRIMALARMPVGGSKFWAHTTNQKRGRHYLQTPDVDRAREVLRDPNARWRLREVDGMRVVTRVA